MNTNSEAKQFFKECVKLIRVNKFNYMEVIKDSPDYIRLSKDYDNLDDLIYLAEDKIGELRKMKSLVEGARARFKNNPDYGLIKFYLLMKHKKDVHSFLMAYGDKSLRNIVERLE